ncbi:MAG TPA: endonuclease/exonuclease/phosphatase family protein [Anaerolineales bacterium]|nr:endonuclease/exonuclease/phosphatase family protein [Anaerolineales bacterium]
MKSRDLIPLALITALGMQSLRVLLPLFQQYLRDSVGIPSLNLAPIALGVFGLAFLPGLLVRRIGLKAALGFVMGAIPLLRLAEQVSRSSPADILLSGAVVVLFWWFLACAYSALAGSAGRGREFAIGLLAGLALDTAIHAAAGTLDLSWQTGLTPLGIVLLLAGLSFTVGASWRERVFAGIDGEPGLAVPGRLFAFGTWLLLEMMFFQNVARTAALADVSLPLAGLAVVAGNALALLYVGFRPDTGRGAAVVAGLLATLLLLFPTVPGMAGVLWLFAGGVVMAVWLVAIAAPAAGATHGKRRGSFGPAALLFVLAAFVFYVSYDIALGVRGMQLLPVFGGLLILAGFAAPAGAAQDRSSRRSYRPALAAGLLLLLPAGYWLTWERPAFVEPPAGNREVRILSYNLHMGFDTDGQLAIEDLARQIEATGADVVALQEVVRGYLTTGSFDMLAWLSNRLGMPYVSGPTGDPQWGNAVLSRYPITDAEVHPLPPADLLLLRGYILATVDIGGGEVTVVATHLHHRGADGHIREEQVPVLVEAWNGGPATVVLGDLNATPETPEMLLLADAGLLNASALWGLPTFTYPSTGADREIDYIWYSPDLAGSDFQIYLSTASDHLPLAVTLTLP